MQAAPLSNAGILHCVQNDRLFVYRHSEAKPKPPRQVAPSPARYARHRFNGRAYSRKGGIWRSLYTKQKAEMQDFFLRFGFNRISNLFVNYII